MAAAFRRFDSDALFCSLLRARKEDADFGFFAIDLADFEGAEQHYEPDTAIVVTTLHDSRGECGARTRKPLPSFACLDVQ